MMIKKARILALVCMICIAAGIVFPGKLSAAETAQPAGSPTAFEFVNEYRSAGSYSVTGV